MAILTILQFPNTGLKLVAEQVNEFGANLKHICDNLVATMYAEDGIGLAATQVNIQQRIFVLDVSEDKKNPICFINPEITESSGEINREEGCLSFPDIYAKVKRKESITVKYQNIKGEPQSMQTDGLLAVCIQHELDHLNGITFFDHLSKLKQKMIKKKIEKMQAYES